MGEQAPTPHQPAVAHRAGSNIWQQLSLLTFCAAFAGLMVSAWLLLQPEAADKLLLEEKLAALAIERDALRTRSDQLDKKLRWLHGDLHYLETQARSELNLQRPGEVILRIVRPDEE